MYRECKQNFPVLPKSHQEVRVYLSGTKVLTNKNENLVLLNDRQTGVIQFSPYSILKCLSSDMEGIFVDGTFKFCPTYLGQLHSTRQK